MNRYFFTILLFMLFQPAVNGQEREYLLPLMPDINVPDILIKYEQTIREYLVRDKDRKKHDMTTRVVVVSSSTLPFS